MKNILNLINQIFLRLPIKVDFVILFEFGFCYFWFIFVGFILFTVLFCFKSTVDDFPSIIFITFPYVEGLTKIGLGSSHY